MRRKTSVWIPALIAVLCGVFLLSGRTVLAAGKDTYTVSVSGGKAYLDGKEISEAKPGDCIELVPDIEKGTYVSEWKVNGKSLENSSWFYMPSGNVKVTAVRKDQKPLVLDLTSTARIPGSYDSPALLEGTGLAPDVNLYLLENIFYVTEDCVEYLDFNGDNLPDAKIIYLLYEFADSVMVPVPGGKVHGDYKIDKPNALPYWPITIHFGEEQVKESYSVTVNGGCATDREGNVITAAAPGELVCVHYKWTEKTWLKEWKADGVSDFHYYYYCSDQKEHWNYDGMDESFIMPAMDLTLHPVTGDKRPYTIDMTKGQAVIGYDVGYCLADSLKPGYNVLMDVDLDGDGTKDINDDYHPDEKTITLTPANTSSVSGSYTIKGLNAGKYWPITVKLPKIDKSSYEITVVGGHAVASVWDEKTSQYTDKTITSAIPGTEVTIIRDSTDGEYWTAWETDYSGIDRSFVRPNFTMPAKDVTVKAKTTKEQKPLVISLEGGLTKKNADFNRLRNTIAFMGFDDFHGLVDIDGDGYYDIAVHSASDSVYPGNLYDCGGMGAAGSFNFEEGVTIKPSDGAYAPITLVAQRPAAFPKQEEHEITVICGKAYAPNGTEVTSARPDRMMYIVPVVPDGKIGVYITGWHADSSDDSFTYYGEDATPQVYFMPDNEVIISITSTLEAQTPIDIDLTCGSFSIPAVYHGITLTEVLKRYAGTGSTDTEGTLDLNRDGTPDVIYTASPNESYFELIFSKAGSDETFSGYFTVRESLPGRYGPIRFNFGQKVNWTVTLDGQEDRSLEKYLGFRTDMIMADAATVRDWGSMTMIRNGASVRILLKDSVPDTIEPVGFYYLDANGAKCEAVLEDGTYRFIMPEANTTISVEFRTKKAVVPEPEDPKKEEGPGKEEEPEKENRAGKKDDFNAWLVLIPAFVLIIAVTTAVMVLYNRKGRKAAAAATILEKDPEAEAYETDTPDETAPAEKGTDDETEV